MERRRFDEMRRDLQEDAALSQGFANEADMPSLKVPQAAVDELRRTAAGAGREVAFFDERDA
jgi:hypothetical protein